MTTAIARNTDPETSHAAAQSITAQRISQLQRTILTIFSEHIGLTDEELMENGRLDYNSQSAIRTRRAELVAMGLVEYTGCKSENISGRLMRVWQITAKGRSHVASQA